MINRLKKFLSQIKKYLPISLALLLIYDYSNPSLSDYLIIMIAVLIIINICAFSIKYDKIIIASLFFYILSFILNLAKFDKSAEKSTTYFFILLLMAFVQKIFTKKYKNEDKSRK